jgi:hypothetical protein
VHRAARSLALGLDYELGSTAAPEPKDQGDPRAS